MAITLEQFVERLTQSGLFTAEELTAFQSSLPLAKQPLDAQGLARELIRAGRLTRFQAEAVYRGHTKGLVMGNYVVLDRIGAGGMGEVLKAHHRRMDRIVALKVLPRKTMQSEDAVKRFYREVKAAARLNHPNIVTAYDADEFDGIHCLVMEFVDGEDLARIVKRRGPMSVDAAIEVTVQAAQGLEYAHHQGVVHRDIKPGNLLLDAQGTVKILDMGLARIDMGESDEPERLTASEQVMGTCDYMAPEQAEDTHAADHRADVYSLGCTFYRLLTGTPPYKGDSLIKILLAHREAPIPSLCAARAEVPPAVDAVYQKMLAKRPEDRYQSMAEVIEAFQACRAPQEAASAARADRPTDSALTSFLDRLAHPEVAASASTEPPAGEETMPSQVLDDTDTSTPRPAPAATAPAAAEPAPTAARKAKSNSIRYVAMAGGAALCVVLLGLLIVVLRRDKDASPLPLAGEGPGVRAVSDKEQPPLARAPFTAEQARWYQRRWADYLGLPVEWENSIGMKFVLIPPGEFTMGSGNAEIEDAIRRRWHERVSERVATERPEHRFTIAHPFYLGSCEVTAGQFGQFVEASGHVTDLEKDANAVTGFTVSAKQGQRGPNDSWRNPGFPQSDDHPVVQVTWNDAAAFCEWVSHRKMAVCRLPTEAEWEYACRAGTSTPWNCGDDPATLRGAANVADASYKEAKPAADVFPWDDGYAYAAPVGRFRPNAFGLFDMTGNVWEWCRDWYAPDAYEHYGHGETDSPASGTDRVQRGACWLDSIPVMCRSAYREHRPPDFCTDAIGFRVVCDIPTDPAELAKFAAAIKEVKPKAESGKREPAEATVDADGWTTLPNGWRFGRPVNLGPVVNSSADEVSPTSSGDGLLLVFASLRPGGRGGYDLWASEREVRSTPFGEPVNLGPAVNSSEWETAPALSLDATTIFFDSQSSDGLGDSDIWMSSRTSRSAAFGKPINLGSIVNSNHREACPALSADGLTLFFDSNRAGGQGEFDLWMTRRTTLDGPFQKPVNLGPLVNSAGQDSGLSVSNDDLAIFFHSDRPGGHGGKDLWMSTRASPAELFRVPLNLGPIANSGEDDSFPELSADGRLLYFSSKRTHGRGGNDLWMAPVEPPGTTFSLPGKPAPLPAVAPFDADQAKKHQQAWADYLSVPVEWTNSIGMQFVLIPPGEFLMGSTEEEQEAAIEEANVANDTAAAERIPTEVPHRVNITKPFYLGRHEVTQAQWTVVMGNNPQELGGPANPVVHVSWESIQPFLVKLEAADRRGYSLPTEAQWEYACRAGTRTAFSFGDDRELLGQYAWFKSTAEGKTQPVGRLKPNAWGLSDMHGNAWEWCADWFALDYYRQSPSSDPSGPPAGRSRVYRGGSCNHRAPRCRSAFRNDAVPDNRASYPDVGFRVACEIPTDPAELAKFAAAIHAAGQEPNAESGKPKAEPGDDPPAPGPAEDVLPGLVPRPAILPGVKRWQIETVAPRADVRSLSYSPDGQLLACAGYEATRIYDAKTGRLTQLIPGRADSVAFSPNGTLLALCRGSSIDLWNVATGKRVLAMPGQARDTFIRFAWSPDGDRLVTGGGYGDPTIRVWNIDGHLLHSWRMEPAVLDLVWSSDGKWIAVITVAHKKVYLWTPDGKPGPVLDDFEPYSLAWSPDGRWLAAGGAERTSASVHVWDTSTWKKAQGCQSGGDRAPGLSWSPDSRRIAYAIGGRRPRIWDIEADSPEEIPIDGSLQDHAIAWNPKDSQIAIGAGGNPGGSLRLWDLESGKPGPAFTYDHAAMAQMISSRDGKTLATLTVHRQSVCIWTAEGRLVAMLDGASQPPGAPMYPDDWEISLKPDGSEVALLDDRSVRLVRPTADASPRLLQGHTASVRCVDWGPTGTLLASGGDDKTVRIWDAAAGKLLHTLNGHTASVGEVAWNADGTRIASRSNDAKDATVRLWTVDGQAGQVIVGHDAGTDGMEWSPDGSQVATFGDGRRAVRVWSALDGKLASELPADYEEVRSVAWSPDNAWLAVLGRHNGRNAVYFWKRDGTAGPVVEEGIVRRGHCGRWSPDSKWFATGGAIEWRDVGTIAIWSPNQERAVAEFFANEMQVKAMQWSADGQYLVSLGADRTLRRWNPLTGELISTSVVLPGRTAAYIGQDGRLETSRPDAANHLAYVVQTDDGRQLTLTAAEFAKQYGNDPAKVNVPK